MLRVDDLSKTFVLHALGGRRLQALRSVSLALDAGHFLAVLGPSGSGKSTLLKCLSRTYLPTGGTACYDSAYLGLVDLAAASEAVMARLRRTEIAVVSQFLRAVPRTPADLVVAEPLLHEGVARSSARDRARDILFRLGLPEALHDAHPATFSGGERQRVNLARALVSRPRLLLLDEPTSALDALDRTRAIEAVAAVVAAGAAAIGVFHDVETVAALADRVLVMRGGQVVDHGSWNEVALPRSTAWAAGGGA